jgi:hypothetical protein
VNKGMMNFRSAFAVLAILLIAPVSVFSTTSPSKALLLQAAPQMSVTPASGYYSSGPQGGPFNPSIQLYSITNSGAGAMTFTASVDQAWASVFIPTGTLNAGESWGNPVTINTQANILTPGTYTATVTFTNTTSGSGNTTRTVTLIVGTTGGDAIAPSVTITNPAPPAATSAATPVTVSGTASDNVAVTSMYWVNMLTNEQGTMPGAASWTFPVGLVNGDNLIHVLAWDAAGNQGQASITIHYGPASGGQMAVSPGTGFTASGPAGGPFSPPQQVYTVTNTGTTSLSFTATATQTWVTVLGGSGTVAPGGSANVVVSFAASANSLAAGTYADNVTFTNTSNGAGNSSRAVSLVIGSGSDTTPPAITIVNPAPPSATASSSPITISGTASDNVGVASISWQNVEGLQSGTVPGGTSWSISVPLVSGANTITVTAHDAGGNTSSSTITVTLTAAAAPGGGGGGGHHRCLGSVAAPSGSGLWIPILGALLAGLRRRKAA